MDVDADGIVFCAGRKPDRRLGKVERSRAQSSGLRCACSPSRGTGQVEMGSSHWPETLEKCRGSSVS
ncbi:hypothetical protein VZT92_008881 [Zoarces viviparus]|uniref:Uncharacterized protein n=1 Tax=Zoarces viviparus TaxID=48416 RepID=A0AAW1FJH5_ZOAVI